MTDERFDKTWKELLELNPTNEDLKCIMELVEPLREKAAIKILEQNPNYDDLLFIIKWVGSESIREEAKKLLKRYSK